MSITLFILLSVGLLFVWGKIRSDIVALMALLSLTIIGVLTPTEALAGFSNPTVLMIAGLFVVGGGIYQTGLAGTISQQLLQRAGDSERKLFVFTLLVTAFFSTFMTNSGTIVLLLPIIYTIAKESNQSARGLLMPMAFSSSMGGMLTLIGTPSVLIIDHILTDNGYESIGFFGILPIGAISLAVGGVLLWKAGQKLKKNDRQKGSRYGGAKSPRELVQEYQLADNLFRISLTDTSPFVHKTLNELNLTQRYHISIIEIRSHKHTTGLFLKSVHTHMANASTVLLKNDVLYVLGCYDDVQKMVKENELKLIGTKETELSAKKTALGDFKFDEIGIAEAVVLSSSKLVNKEVKKLGFRDRYHVNILGIKRKNKYLLNSVQNEQIQAGDSLLMQGAWTDIDTLDDEESELIVVGKPTEEAGKVTLKHKSRTAGVILVIMVLTIAFQLLAPVVAVLTAAVLMILFGCFKNVEVALTTIKWQSVIFLASMFPLGTALEKTGTIQYVSEYLITTFHSLGIYGVLTILYVGTSLVTLFTNSTTSTILFAPVALYTAQKLQIDPLLLLVGVAVAANLSFMSPYASPASGMVMSAGGYAYRDYVRIGLPLEIIFAIIMIAVLPLIYGH